MSVNYGTFVTYILAKVNIWEKELRQDLSRNQFPRDWSMATKLYLSIFRTSHIPDGTVLCPNPSVMNSIIVTYNREKPTVSKLSRCPLLHSWTSGTAPDHQRTSGKPSLSPLLLLLQLGPFRVSSARSSPKSSRMVQTNQLTATGMRTNAVFGAHQWASWFRLFQKKTLNSIQIFNIKRVERLRWLWVPSLVKARKKKDQTPNFTQSVPTMEAMTTTTARGLGDREINRERLKERNAERDENP